MNGGIEGEQALPRQGSEENVGRGGRFRAIPTFAAPAPRIGAGITSSETPGIGPTRR
jgi:hypothetical protein